MTRQEKHAINDDEALFQVIADGSEWEDADGLTSWPEREVVTLADIIEGLGYDDVQVLQVSGRLHARAS